MTRAVADRDARMLLLSRFRSVAYAALVNGLSEADLQEALRVAAAAARRTAGRGLRLVPPPR